MKEQKKQLEGITKKKDVLKEELRSNEVDLTQSKAKVEKLQQ